MFYDNDKIISRYFNLCDQSKYYLLYENYTHHSEIFTIFFLINQKFIFIIFIIYIICYIRNCTHYSNVMHFFLTGDTRLGLMWSCMTLYNRPQVCYKSDLQSEWLMALICIFVGCILITATIILLVISHWDRSVIPYARWVGFGASTYQRNMIFNIIKCA